MLCHLLPEWPYYLAGRMNIIEDIENEEVMPYLVPPRLSDPHQVVFPLSTVKANLPVGTEGNKPEQHKQNRVFDSQQRKHFWLPLKIVPQFGI